MKAKLEINHRCVINQYIISLEQKWETDKLK